MATTDETSHACTVYNIVKFICLKGTEPNMVTVSSPSWIGIQYTPIMLLQPPRATTHKSKANKMRQRVDGRPFLVPACRWTAAF